jgi:hypothetical protein
MTAIEMILKRIAALEAAIRPQPGDEVERLPTAAVAQRYGVSIKSIERWIANPSINFPPPSIVINGRRYWKIDVLEAYDRAAVLTVGKKRARGRPPHYRCEIIKPEAA